MKAVRIIEHGGIEKLIYDEIPEPSCFSDKIKILIPIASFIIKKYTSYAASLFSMW